MLIEIAGEESVEKVKIFAISRKEADIERALQHTFTAISLSNPEVDKDIRTYVQNYIHDNRNLSRWPLSLRSEMETTLVKGAKGMYVPTSTQGSTVLCPFLLADAS